jgi:transposase
MDTSTQAIQVRGKERRRFRTEEEKRRIVEAALQPGASVARVARAYGVNANQLFGWRRLYLEGRLEPKKNRETPGLLAVRVVPGVRDAARRSNAPAAWGTMQIELAKGTMRIAGMADPESLRTVLEYLTR